MSSGRGGRGRGGSFSSGPSGRGGAGGGQQSGPTNRHNSRNFAEKNFHNRRGGSFNSGTGGSGYSHSSSSSFRGRNQGHSGSGRGNRNDGSAIGSRDGTMTSSFGGKRDENRRTLTDFKIVGLKIPALGWSWGIVPTTNKEETHNDLGSKSVSEENSKEVNLEEGKEGKAANLPVVEGKQSALKTESARIASPAGEVEMTDALTSHVADSNPHSPPSRIRIYFHTPVTADDSRPIPHNALYGENSTDSRKGKRKKLEEDDGELDEIRAPPPPQIVGANEDRGSAAGSISQSVETASEADWLMAAIVEGEEENRAAAELHPGEESEDVEQLQISQIINEDEPAMHEDDDHDAHDVDEALFDGKHYRSIDNATFGVEVPTLLSAGKREGLLFSRTC
jgi:20S proteasome subunit alpha 6